MNQAKTDAIAQMALNHFELRLRTRTTRELDDASHTGADELWLVPEIWIEGQLLDEPHTVAVNAVSQSFAKSGARSWSGNWHFIFTDPSGSASGANIEEGIGAVQGDETVEWVFRRPQANGFGANPLGFKQWCETARWHSYLFDRSQALREVSRFLEEVWLLINTDGIHIAGKFDVLNWFIDDPRDNLRFRSLSPWRDQAS